MISDEEVEMELERLLIEDEKEKIENNKIIEKLVHKEDIRETEEEIVKTIELLNCDKNTVEIFDPGEDIVEDEEIYADDDDNSEYLEDLRGVEELLHEVIALTDDVLENGFTDELINFDISDLETGEVVDDETDKEEE